MLNTFPTRISVDAGDVIGLFFAFGSGNCYRTNAAASGYTTHGYFGTN